jgi:membrane-associated phospholipid phosphatase
MQDYAASPIKAASFSRSFLCFLALSVLWCLLLILFNRVPEIDLSISRSVFTQMPCSGPDPLHGTCGLFLYDRNSLLNILRRISLTLPYLAVAVLVCVLIISRRKLGAHWRTAPVEMSIVALLSLLLNSGIIVNLLLKTFSGRPRPRDTDIFGGTLDFVQAGSFAGKCLKNCSFISGEASSGGWLLCLILLLPPRWRLSLGLPLAIISLLMPTMRVVMGAHYLSDAVLGWLSSLVVFAALLTISEALAGGPLRRPVMR